MIITIPFTYLSTLSLLSNFRKAGENALGLLLVTVCNVTGSKLECAGGPVVNKSVHLFIYFV